MKHGKSWIFLLAAIGLTVAIAALLVNIFQHKQEGRLTYLMITPIAPLEIDPAKWAVDFPREYATYLKTKDTPALVDYGKVGKYEGPAQTDKLAADPNLKRMFAGYPFSVEYKDDRGHMHALEDMLATKRLGDNKPGPCMTCKSPQVLTFMQQYGPAKYYKTPVKSLVDDYHFKQTIACADCHDAQTMDLKVQRPAFVEAMAKRGIDVSKATRQEMRTYVCAQCHVEYYWQKSDLYLTFPWQRGLNIDSIEAYYDALDFHDWEHAETKAPLIKIQHPEFETWSSGVHARAGVACADCHMSYVREGAVKVSDHWVRSPLLNISNTCLVCHRESEQEMRDRVIEIQDRTYSLLTKAEGATLAAMNQIKEAMAAGATDDELKEARALQRRAQIRWDFVAAENSMGFHSPQETARVLGDAIDYARQAELSAFKAKMKEGS
jgi:nitrite reductase (cytochrome c-552)